MGLLASDTGADTAGTLLENHTATVLGGIWHRSAHCTAGAAVVSGANRFRSASATSQNLYYLRVAPLTPGQLSIQADFTCQSVIGDIVGLVLGCDPASFTGYICQIVNGTGMNVQQQYNGVGTFLQTSTGPAFVLSSVHTIKFMLTATNNGDVTLRVYKDAVLTFTLTDAVSSIFGNVLGAAPGTIPPFYAGLEFSSAVASDSTGMHISNVLVNDVPLLKATPSAIVVNSVGNVLSLAAPGAAWTPGTPGTPTLTLTGGTGAALSAQTMTNQDEGVVTLAAGSATGALTITDPTGLETAVVQVIPATQTIPVNNANLFFSPYNWYINGSVYAQSNASGAYLKTNLTSTSISINVDVTPLSGALAAAGNYPTLSYCFTASADSPTWGWVDVQLAPGMTNIVLLANGANTAHTVHIYIKSTAFSIDRWTTPASVVRITGIVIDAGGSVGAVFGLASKRLLAYGDSITEGSRIALKSSNLRCLDGRQAHMRYVAQALNAEYGQVAYGAQGYSVSGNGNVPPLFTAGNAALTSWDKYDSLHSRLSGGLLTPAPDYITVNEGANDGGTDVTTRVTGLLSALRAAAPTAWIILLVPSAGGARLAQLTAGVAAYQAVTVDSRVVIIDPTALVTTNLPPQSLDGLHPSYYGQGQTGSVVAALINAAITGAPLALGPAFAGGF